MLKIFALLMLLSPTAVWASSAALIDEKYQTITFLIFAILFILSLLITWLAAKKNNSVGEFYTAGGSISAFRNGLAIAGDYLSAAAFLGVSGLIALYGFDGVNYLIGFFVAFIPVLLLVAEPCRNLGKYTLGDVLAWRNGYRSTKSIAAFSSVIVALFYMVPQIVGGAAIVHALIGIPYEMSVISVGILMLIYVAFGGMRATTIVMISKAVLLISCCFVLVCLAWFPFYFNGFAFFNALASSESLQQYVTSISSVPLSGEAAGQRFLEAGLYLKNPLEQISLGLALLLGTAAMPHILMRFFAVKTATDARKSVMWGMFFIGFCHLLIICIGFSCAYYIGGDAIKAIDKGGNLATPLLAQFLGGGGDSFAGNLLLAFVAAISFATIVAVVAGLTLAAASAIAHDIYIGAVKSGVASERQQTIAARLATIAITFIAIVAGIAAKGQNVAYLVGLGYAVAASANLPALLLSLYWKPCNTKGVFIGILGGTLISIVMVLVSPAMNYPLLQKQKLQQQLLLLEKTPNPDAAILIQKQGLQNQINAIPDNATSIVGLTKPMIPLNNPGIISIPIGFLLVIVFSLIFKDQQARNKWPELTIRKNMAVPIKSD